MHFNMKAVLPSQARTVSSKLKIIPCKTDYFLVRAVISLDVITLDIRYLDVSLIFFLISLTRELNEVSCGCYGGLMPLKAKYNDSKHYPIEWYRVRGSNLVDT